VYAICVRDIKFYATRGLWHIVLFFCSEPRTSHSKEREMWSGTCVLLAMIDIGILGLNIVLYSERVFMSRLMR
jgi:hypothetical protein